MSTRSSRLLRTAYLLTHEWPTAEDLLQTSLVKAWGAWQRIESDPESTLDDQHGAFDARDGVWRALGRLPRRQS